MESTGGVECVLDATSHLMPCDGEVLEAKRDFAIDDVVHGLQLGVLEHEADVSGELPGAGGDDVEASNRRASGYLATVEMGDEAVENAEQRRLAAPGWTGDHRQSFVDLEAHITEGRLGGARVPVGDAV